MRAHIPGMSNAAAKSRNAVRGFVGASPARGILMGNRGGRFHTDARTLIARRWASRQWICCVLDFKGRQRDVWGRFYTELFFLDELTAFAAGHRPCFECRRKEAEVFAECGIGAQASYAAQSAVRWTTSCTRERLQVAPSVCTGATSSVAGRRIHCAGRGSFHGSRRCVAALDAGGLRCAQAAAARYRGRCADAAGNACGAFSRLQAAVAF